MCQHNKENRTVKKSIKEWKRRRTLEALCGVEFEGGGCFCMQEEAMYLRQGGNYMSGMKVPR